MTTPFSNDQARWTAILNRSRPADGVFIYAVKTTGIYCRPTCRSRIPKRRNVEFFDTCYEARRHGFRACKRCNPDSPVARSIPEAVVKACHLIDDAEQQIPLEQLARAVGLSASHFHRLFKKTVGVTPKAYAATTRMNRFRERLRDQATVTDAMYDAGYAASSRCYEEVGRSLGMTPTQFKRGGAGQLIRFAVVECTLGWISVAATQRGVCSIELGDNRSSLRGQLEARFANAELCEGDVTFHEWVARVIEYVEVPGQHLDVPLDIQGTAFQRQVWQQLQLIPAGQTATYTEIAGRIGKPKAARAVAGACAANKLAIAIPCHRVVGKNQAPAGYRWGSERKRALLERERGGERGLSVPPEG